MLSSVSPIEVDAAIFIALEEEFKWFTEIFNGTMTTIHDEPYYFYRVRHDAGRKEPYELVLVLGGSLGGMNAAVTTSHLLERFRVRTMVNIGIAGA